MSVMEKRLQLLLDAERYDLVFAEAQRTGRSVASIIRQSIDEHFGDRAATVRRAEAAKHFLELTAEHESGPGQSWEEMKQEIEDDLTSYVDGKASA
jgi:hypothetical protein